MGDDDRDRDGWLPVCSYCGRIMSWREYTEQGACNDCAGGAS